MFCVQEFDEEYVENLLLILYVCNRVISERLVGNPKIMQVLVSEKRRVMCGSREM